MSVFSDRLAQLGFTTYAQYLNSDHWADFKKRYFRAKGKPGCAVCKKKRVDLHHHTYQRLGAERFEDITPLCGKHHVAVHDWLRLHKNGNVGATRKAVLALRSQTKNARKQKEEVPVAQPVATKPKKKRETLKQRDLRLEQEKRDAFDEVMRNWKPSPTPPAAKSKVVWKEVPVDGSENQKTWVAVRTDGQ